MINVNRKMTLKAFHILFISVSILLTFFVGVWCLTADYPAENRVAQLSLGVLSFAAAAGLLWYGGWFLKKLKHPRLI